MSASDAISKQTGLGSVSDVGTQGGFSPATNLQDFLEYSLHSDSLASIEIPGQVESYDPGGSPTGVFERWEGKMIEVKKFIDDVNGSRKLHTNSNYRSKIVNGDEEICYIKAVQAQALFNKMKGGAAKKGMKLNPKKTTLLCMSAARSYTPKTYI